MLSVRRNLLAGLESILNCTGHFLIMQEDREKLESQLHDMALMVERLEGSRQKLLMEVFDAAFLFFEQNKFPMSWLSFGLCLTDWFSIIRNRKAVWGELSLVYFIPRSCSCYNAMGKPGVLLSVISCMERQTFIIYGWYQHLACSINHNFQVKDCLKQNEELRSHLEKLRLEQATLLKTSNTTIQPDGQNETSISFPPEFVTENLSLKVDCWSCREYFLVYTMTSQIYLLSCHWFTTAYFIVYRISSSKNRADPRGCRQK